MALTDVFQAIQQNLGFKKTVEISGIKFEMGLLTFDEEMKSDAFPQDEMEPLVFYNQTRLQTLAYSIRSINGEKIPAVVEIKNGDAIEKKQGSLYVKEFLSRLPIKVIEQLFDVYIDIKDQAESSIGKEMKYDWFKTPEQREKERDKKEENVNESKDESSGSSEEKEIEFREVNEPPEEEKPSA
jgi:hypothetical protein